MINTLLDRFNGLSDREKIIVICTLLIAIWGAWDKLVYLPFSTEQKKLATELSNIEMQLSAQQQAAQQIEALGKIDPNQAKKNTLSNIKIELTKLRKQLDIGEKRFVPANLMAQVLHDLLKKNHGLQLINLETLPVSPFTESSSQKSWVYRHGLSITLSGNYFNTLNYLKSLESLPWRFNWDSIDYKVKEYPVAETTLKVYTLSFEENWLGL